MKKRVALISFGSPNNMKGLIINVHERAIRLNNLEANIDFDFYLIRFKDSKLFSILKGTNENVEEETLIGEVKYKNIWINRSVLGYFLTYILKVNSIISKQFFIRATSVIKKYDIVLSHGYEANYFANKNFLINNVPFIASWHGSDINLYPFRNKRIFRSIENIIENASSNQFVSKRLLDKSHEITVRGQKEVLYTGISENFYKYSEDKVLILKEQYNSLNKIVIGFVGNLISIKNPLVIPAIVANLHNPNRFQVWIIGDGNLEYSLKEQFEKLKLDYKFFGKVSPQEIPNLMNCMSFLIIPSLNEGLPRVVLEAISCGIHVIGSDVGGIPEVLPPQNYFPLDENFIVNISNRIDNIVDFKISPSLLDEKFKWSKTIDEILYNINTI